jgi:ABC-type sugar transport system ATPase subunit
VMITADRQKDGIVPQLSVLENITLGLHRRDLTWRGLAVRHGHCREICENLIRKLQIKTAGLDQPAGMLSGGNQQKLLLARAVINNPRLLLIDEPTRGIDVGAKQDVYAWIRSAAHQGAAILVSSLEEPELLGLAQEIVVLRDGRHVATVKSAETTERELIELAGGGSSV